MTILPRFGVQAVLAALFAVSIRAQTIFEIANQTANLSTLVTALEAANLTATFSGEGNFTVFAPTNEAFAALPSGVLAGLLNETAALTDVLTYHVIDGA
eukprot:CAMPEP_0170597018 /NCGR_PEP_ID=MMETSP0224-20130122/15468_1 /TAXON_ID=285029 /ORGANISM="Togula jolla, Strain CCCM 725" /LENGTH=98 /DNA_ID=CAMNT_0010921431 /DNA_START=48 /DNA_END=340 /DNA_ORIENTATION=-